MDTPDLKATQRSASMFAETLNKKKKTSLKQTAYVQQ